jgi:hypothetical protein
MSEKRESLSYLCNSGRLARLNYSADDVDVRSLAKWGERAGKDSRWGGEAARPPLIHGRHASRRETFLRAVMLRYELPLPVRLLLLCSAYALASMC